MSEGTPQVRQFGFFLGVVVAAAVMGPASLAATPHTTVDTHLVGAPGRSDASRRGGGGRPAAGGCGRLSCGGEPGDVG